MRSVGYLEAVTTFQTSKIAECTDDKEAVVRAIQAAASGFDVEIWDYKRFVARLPGNPLSNPRKK
jgi:hypothetical protein